MNTFIILGCQPVPEWQHKIDFVAKKTVLHKDNTYILVRKKNILPPLPLGVFGVKKVAVLGGGGVCCRTMARGVKLNQIVIQKKQKKKQNKS